MEVNNISFKAKPNIFLNAAKNFITLKESSGNLSHVRFIQDSAIGLAPKAVFARSKADLAENSFLELSESLLVYYAPSILGTKIFQKLYSKKLSPADAKQIITPAAELLKNKNFNSNKQLLRIKAAISLGCLAIPVCEYSLSYIKNLFTLNFFKTGEFNTIANLSKNKKTDEKINQNVKNNALKHIKNAALVYGGILASSLLLGLKGKNSKFLNNISEFILAPGSKLFKHNKNKADVVNKYFGLDFANKNGKLAMSNGQLTACVLAGGFGYFGAAKDRGKQNLLEVASTFPLVGFYIVCGNELLEKGFRKFLYKNNYCKDVLDKNLSVLPMKKLESAAEKIAATTFKNKQEIYNKLLKQKAFISLVPFLFGIGVMGFFVVGMSRLFTKMRYQLSLKKQEKEKIIESQQKMIISEKLSFKALS